MKKRTSLLLRFAAIGLFLLVFANLALIRLFRRDPLAEAIPVELEEAITTSLQTRVVGSCTFRSQRSVQIISDVGGRAIAIPVQVGEPVMAGQVLVQFDQTPHLNSLAQTQAVLRQNELSLAHHLAKLRTTIVSRERLWNEHVRALERNRAFHLSGTVSDDQLAQAEQAERDAFDSLKNARAELNLAASQPVDAVPPIYADNDAHIIANDPTVIQSRLAAERASDNLRQATVLAPFKGTVTRLAATLGNHLNAGHPVATVETLEDIIANVQIDEIDIGKIRVGQEVTLTTETLLNVDLLGKITLVPPSMETPGNVPLVTINVQVDQSSLPEGARLIVGSSCRARINANLKKAATAVPYAALLERAGSMTAFVATLVEETAGQYVLEQREVEIGVSTPTQVEIKEGVKPGELVVVGNLALLRNGLSVMVKRESGEEQSLEEDVIDGPVAGKPAEKSPTDRS